ncbi:L-serine ammonia-lyase, iron-sulfur-dependent subunit beta [Coraliomargarita sp. W4R53]
MQFSAFDVIGPAMIGPSSSHTAGAARIGLAARHLLGQAVVSAQINLHGSFAATGKGHATDRALVAGLLGMGADDERIKDSLVYAQKVSLACEFHEVDLGEDAHPNSVLLNVSAADGAQLRLLAHSIGGGVIEISEIDGFKTSIRGELDTLVLWNHDAPGYLAKITTLYECANLNIATIRLSRTSRGDAALTTIESDGPLPTEAFSMMSRLPATRRQRSLPPHWPAILI